MTGWLVETLYAVTLLMLLVLAVRKPVAHCFGAGWAYALWLLPALRLVLPPLNIFGTTIPSVLPRAPAVAPSIGAAVVPSTEVLPALQWEPILLSIWAAGVVLFVLWQGWAYFAFLKRLGIGSHIHASLAQDIGVVESPEVEGPIAIGLLDRWIVVPADFAARYTPAEQRLALRHERIHHQREDIFCNMVALGVLALNWFNPVAYIAFRAFRTDQELSCDAAVAAEASSVERHDYARALVKSASKPGLVAACPLNHAGQLKRRLRMMKAHRKSGLRALGGSSAVAMLMLGGIGVTQAGAAQQPAPDAPLASARPVGAVAPTPAAQPVTRAGKAAAPRAKAAARRSNAVAPVARASTSAVKTEAPAATRAAAPVAEVAPAAPVASSFSPEPAPAAVKTPEAHRRSEAAPAEKVAAAAAAGKPIKYKVVRTHVRTVHGATAMQMQMKAENLMHQSQRGMAIRLAPRPAR